MHRAPANVAGLGSIEELDPSSGGLCEADLHFHKTTRFVGERVVDVSSSTGTEECKRRSTSRQGQDDYKSKDRNFRAPADVARSAGYI